MTRVLKFAPNPPLAGLSRMWRRFSWVFAVLALNACGRAPSRCDSSNCLGCCDATGSCQVGTTSQACGASGLQCAACAIGMSCNFGFCSLGNVGGGSANGTGGGRATGGGSGTGGGSSSTGGGGTSNTGGGTSSTGGGTSSTGGGTTSTGGGTSSTGGGTTSTGGGTTSTGGGTTSTGGGTTSTGGGTNTTSEEIATVRAYAANSTGSLLTIHAALITDLRPPVLDAGTNDPAGFFIQAEPAGPAIFVAVDPATLTPPMQIGDQLTLTPSSAGHVGGNLNTPLCISSLKSYSKLSSGHSVAGFVRDISNIDFVSQITLDKYESQLTSITGTIASDFSPAGTAFLSAALVTAGSPQSSGVKVRVPITLQASEDLAPGCLVSIGSTGLWRFGTATQPSAFSSAQLSGTSCPAPRVLWATSSSATSVVMTFDRNLLGSTVTASNFAASNLSVFGATLTGPREVTLSTATQSAQTTYTFTISPAVTDTRGTPVESGASVSCSTCGEPLVISQYYPGGTNAGSTYNTRFVELHNRSNTSISLANYSLQYPGNAHTDGRWGVALPLSGTIAPNGYFLVALGTGSGGTLPVSPDLSLSLQPSYTDGALALVRGTRTLNGQCPLSADIVGYGSTNCALGTAVASLTQTTAAIRNQGGCADARNNSADFTLAAPSPRNSASAALACTCN